MKSRAEKLPEVCYSLMPGTGELIIIKRGETGYYHCGLSCEDEAKNRRLADLLNGKMEVSKAQESAMLHGSMFGWNAAAADPDLYDENGNMTLNPPSSLSPQSENDFFVHEENEDDHDEEI